MRMAAQTLLAQLLAYSALLGATIEYFEIVRRRVTHRRLEAERLAAERAGLQGLVRVLLSEG
jgi:hypothetical protein